MPDKCTPTRKADFEIDWQNESCHLDLEDTGDEFWQRYRREEEQARVSRIKGDGATS